MQWIMENWDKVAFALTSIVAAASAIAAITPTPKDDDFLKKVYSVIDALALNVGKAKEK